MGSRSAGGSAVRDPGAGGELEFENPAPDWERFRITAFVDECAMGSVYLAVDRRLSGAPPIRPLKL